MVNFEAIGALLKYMEVPLIILFISVTMFLFIQSVKLVADKDKEEREENNEK